MSDSSALERRLLATVAAVVRRAGPSPDAPFLVAVSGGSDSVALLLLLRRLGLPNPLFVLHVDHGLRGAQSDADRDFVVRLAERLGLPCRVFRLKEGLGRRDGSFSENDAREARWSCFFRMQDEMPGSWLLVGQQLEDQAETMLLHLFRGAALQGLGAMRAVDTRRRLLRPLLELERRDLRCWLEEIAEAWREDQSNFETLQLRNALRLELVPLLDSLFDPGWPARLARTSGFLREDEEVLQQEARAAARRLVRLHTRDGRRTVGLEDLPDAVLATVRLEDYRRVPPTLRRRILQQLFAWLSGDARDFTAVMLGGLDDYIAWERHPCPALPGDLKMQRTGDSCHFWSRRTLAAWSGWFTCSGGQRLLLASETLKTAWLSADPGAREELETLVSGGSLGYTSVPRMATDAVPGIGFQRGRDSDPERRYTVLKEDRRRAGRLLHKLGVPAVLRSRVVWLEWPDGRRQMAGMPLEEKGREGDP
ncbi:MAG: tRNA lysidine(34) synthetase TilS [Bacillota bacterium]|nr:tRNA lysidine(34) synthetase TilS [Bacillota bacterium]